MPSIIPSLRHFSRVAASAAALLLVSACGDAPKYKESNGEFPEWQGYEGKHFYPSNGTVNAVDIAANTVTLGNGKHTNVYHVTSETRIIHEGTDITLAQLPLAEQVKYTVSGDNKQLLTIWYGTRLYEFHPPAGVRQ